MQLVHKVCIFGGIGWGGIPDAENSKDGAAIICRSRQSASTSSSLLPPARGHTNRIRVRLPSNYVIAALGRGFGGVSAAGNKSQCSALLHRVRLPLNTLNSHDLNSLLTFQPSD